MLLNTSNEQVAGPVLVKDLVLPEDVQKEVRKYCAEYWWPSARQRARVEQEIKLQYFFGGQDIAYLCSKEGLVVVAAGKFGTEEFRQAEAQISPEDQKRLVYYTPGIWNDPVGTLPSTFDLCDP